MTTIIAIDPGSRITGFGVIRVSGNQSHYVTSGCVRVAREQVSSRLQQIYAAIQTLVLEHQPDEAAIEQIFMHKNPNSALKLGQARGVAIVALGMTVAEYSARQVKQAVVGYGAAKKDQVQHMVQRLLNLSAAPQADAADALAIALCHAHTRGSLVQHAKPDRARKSSWRDYQEILQKTSEK